MSDPVPIPEPITEPTPQPEPVSKPESIIRDDGQFSEAYLASLPDDLGKHSIFQKYNNPLDMVKGTINAQKIASKKAEDFWTSEDPDVVTKRKEIMGVPKDASGYDFDSEGLPNVLKDSASNRATEFKAFAAEKGWPKAMVEEALAWDKDGTIKEFESASEQNQIAINEADAALHKEWKGDKYEYNMAKIKDTLAHVGLEKWAEDGSFGNNPERMKEFFDVIVPLVSDDSIIEARQNESYASISDTLSLLEQKMNDYSGNTRDAVYSNMVTERAKLLQKLPRK